MTSAGSAQRHEESMSRASSHSPQPTTRSRVWLSRSLGSLCPLRPDDLLLSLSFKQNQLSGEPRYEHVTGSRLFGSSTRRLGGTRFLRLLRLRDGTELLHHTQIIVALPLLDYLAPFNGVYGDTFELYLLPGGAMSISSPW